MRNKILLAVGISLSLGWIWGVWSVMGSECRGQYYDALVMERQDGIHFDGTITERSVADLLAAINRSQASEPTVWLESGGGDINAAFLLALMISGRSVRMSVGHNAICASACIILFLAGKEHTADPSAAFGIHAPYCQGRLSDLECLVEKGYTKGDEEYKMFIAQRAPEWYAKAVADHAFDFPPERVFCYSFPTGDGAVPVSENESSVSRGNCALSSALLNVSPMKPEYRIPAECPVSMWQQLGMIFRYLSGHAQKIARHKYPQ